MSFKEQYEEIAGVGRTIFDNPELGYKEFKTHQTVTEFLKKVNPDIESQSFSTTGLRTTLGDGKPLNIAFIAELTPFTLQRIGDRIRRRERHTIAVIIRRWRSHWLCTNIMLNQRRTKPLIIV